MYVCVCACPCVCVCAHVCVCVCMWSTSHTSFCPLCVGVNLWNVWMLVRLSVWQGGGGRRGKQMLHPNATLFRWALVRVTICPGEHLSYIRSKQMIIKVYEECSFQTHICTYALHTRIYIKNKTYKKKKKKKHCVKQAISVENKLTCYSGSQGRRHISG